MSKMVSALVRRKCSIAEIERLINAGFATRLLEDGRVEIEVLDTTANVRKAIAKTKKPRSRP